MEKTNLIRELIKSLNYYTEQYNSGKPQITDRGWDDLYFTLQQLEKETGIIYPDSPTQTIFYNAVNKLNKKEHNHKMLSLQKTKDTEEVVSFFGDRHIVAMCKMDGLTCSLTYKNGTLVSAETRGNGLVGEDILHNAQIIPSIPQHISTTEGITIDGEIICTITEFEKVSEKYKNSRNYAAGSIRLLNSEECASRNLTFVAWDMPFPMPDSLGGELSQTEKLAELMELGFETVPFVEFKSSEVSVETVIEHLKTKATRLSYPIDGIVFKFDDCAYGRSLGETSHHFKNAIAYKFYDETYPTTLLDIEWNVGRTGQITPVAIFEPVEIDGSENHRASLHNISIIEQLFPRGAWIGQQIEVYKANMINPQVASSCDIEVPGAVPLDIPITCPICGKPTTIKTDNSSTVLWCDNPLCEGKFINKLVYFCGKSGLDIKGLSKKTLDKLVEWEWVSCFADLFELHNHRAEWINKPGFGEKSVDKVLDAIETARNQKVENFISAIGIPLIGLSMAKELVKHFPSYDLFRDAVIDGYDFTSIDGFAEAKNRAIHSFDYTEADAAARYLKFSVIENNEAEEGANSLANLTFVITGKLHTFKNRNELQDYIVARGGKVVSTISNKVNYLINNDVTSTSAKNLAAQKAGIPIISEENLLKNF